MPLILTIENRECLPPGVRVSYRLADRERLDVGRRVAGVGWTLPDPARFISGTHCEIRWRAGAFWLYDVSTNGTFVNGERRRIVAPHRLESGDRIAVGAYVLAVSIEAEPFGARRPVMAAGVPAPRGAMATA